MIRLTWLSGDKELVIHIGGIGGVFEDEIGTRIICPLGTIPVKESVDQVLDLIQMSHEGAMQKQVNAFEQMFDDLYKRLEAIEERTRNDALVAALKKIAGEPK